MSVWECIGMVLVVWALLALLAGAAAQRDRLTRLERKLDVLLRQQGLGDAWQPTPSARVRESMASGRKIEAIRAYREENPQVGLKEAKDAVEAMMAGG